MSKGTISLKEINDTQNLKGTILGLLQYKDKFYFSSYLNDKSGRIYCSVKESILARYFNNELRLQEVFLASEDIIVPYNFRNENVYSIRGKLAELIACGKKLFSENSEGMRNDSLAEVFAI